MKLLIPTVGALRAADTKLMRLAEFLGIECQVLPLLPADAHHAEHLKSALAQQQGCLVVNPDVLKQWLGENPTSANLAGTFTSRCSALIVHAVRPEPFHEALVSALSNGRLHGVAEIQAADGGYHVAPHASDVCEAFTGLTFGPANQRNDRVFKSAENSGVRKLISIGGEALLALVESNQAKALFIGSEDVADLETEVEGDWLAQVFSQMLPHAMALRFLFGDSTWRPVERHASIVVDDPLLRRNYGFLNFDRLLGLMRQHHFQTTIAFIPYNFRRSSRRVVNLFRENADCLALCFHGNDHTGAEFAAADPVLLNTMLHVAEQRMSVHTRKTGLACDRVMVFPQGQFSVESMAALKARNFDAVVNTVIRPRATQIRLTLRELAQPAVLRYAGFPLFLRKNSLRTQSADIAFNLFFGRPILIVEHHEIFQDAQPLIDAVNRINTVAPGIHWSNLGTVVSRSMLRRTQPDGSYTVRAFSRSVRVTNPSPSLKRFSVEWNYFTDEARVESMLRDSQPFRNFAADQNGVRATIELEPHGSAQLTVQLAAPAVSLCRFGIRHSTRAFVRRTLSEVRDNYLSKNPSLLAAAKTLHKRLQPAK